MQLDKSKNLCSVAQLDYDGWQSLILYFKLAKQRRFSMFLWQIINVGGDGYASYPDLIIIYNVCVLKFYTIFQKYVQLFFN